MAACFIKLGIPFDINCLSYASALYTSFQSDDERNITANPLVWSFDNYSRNSIFEYRLVTFLSYALN